MHHGLLERSNRPDRPHPDQADLALLRRTTHLHGKRDDLGEQDGREHDQVLIAAEKCFHSKTRTSEPVSGSLSHLSRGRRSKSRVPRGGLQAATWVTWDPP